MVLISVVIPSLNSAATLATCLESVAAQKEVEIETIIVDSNSKDGSVQIAEKFGRVLVRESGMTRAREIGAREARGDFILNLDSDQVLMPETLSRCLATRSPIVALGEASEGTGLVATLNRWDRAFTEKHWRENLSPAGGSIRPRFYASSVLRGAFDKIPNWVLDVRPCPFSEDTVIFMAASDGGSNVAYVPNAVRHREEERVIRYLRKWVQYGRTARRYKGTEFEALILGRGGRRGGTLVAAPTIPARVLKAVPFFVGYSL